MRDKVIIASVAIFILGWIFYMNTPSFGIRKEGVAMSSYSSNQAKDLGVFIELYIPASNIMTAGDIDIEILESWLEYKWSYADQQGNIQKGRQMQLVIRIDEEVDLLDINNLKLKSDHSIGVGKKRHSILIPIQEPLDEISLMFSLEGDSSLSTFYREN